MTFRALQQHNHFTNALQAAGVKAFLHEETETYYIQRGPVTYLSAVPQTSDFAALRRIRPWSICVLNLDSPATNALKTAGFRQIMTPASVAEIDLTQPVHLKAKWRNALRKSQKSPFETSHQPFNVVRDAWLFEADTTQQRQKRFRAMPHAVSAEWPRADTLLSTASENGEIIAAMLFLVHGSVATYQIGWSNTRGRHVCAHQRVLFEAQEHLIKGGVQRLDLGSIDTENSQGLARFKIGAGAQVRQLGGTWIAMPQWRR